MKRPITTASTLLAALVLAGPAAAAPTVVPTWDAGGTPGLAVNAGGQGIVAFVHGEHVRVAQVNPDGSIASMTKVEGDRMVFTEGGPQDVSAGIDEAGRAYVGYDGFDGQMPLLDGEGYGFELPPYASVFTFGTPPPPAQRLIGGPIRVDDGIAFGQSADGGVVALAADPNGRHSYRATLAPTGAPAVTRPAALRNAGPLGIARGVEAWGSLRQLLIVEPGGTLERFKTDGKRLSAGAFRVDAAGDQFVAWRRDKDYDHPLDIRAAWRRPGAKAFGRPAIVAKRESLIAAELGSTPNAALLITYGKRFALVRSTPDGRSSKPIVLPGSNRETYSDGVDPNTQQTLSVADDGSVLVAYTAGTPKRFSARVVRVSAAGAVTRLADIPGSGVLALAGAPNGIGLLALGHDDDPDTPGGVDEVLAIR